VIEVYRLHSSRYPANDGTGAAVAGGRWNSRGTEVIYAAASRSLAVLEIVVHYSVLPSDFVITPISIPDAVSIVTVPETILVDGWNQPIPLPATQAYGTEWVISGSAAILSVPSAVVPAERNYILNPRHSDFSAIAFGLSEPFRFDARLKKP
jgi:RES domain-containing protein